MCDGSFRSGRTDQDIQRFVEAVVSRIDEDRLYHPIYISNPLDESVFPRDIASPCMVWEDENPRSDMWLIRVSFQGGTHSVYVMTDHPTWIPAKDVWDLIKANSVEKRASVTIFGVTQEEPPEVAARGRITLITSKDEVGAPIFYKEIPPLFSLAVENPELSRWRLADIGSYEEPRTVLDDLPVCASCHSFSMHGKVIGTDMDLKGDKGGYVLTPVKKTIRVSERNFVSWNDFRQSDGQASMGLFARVSPDGDYVISTVKEKTLFAMLDDFDFSQLFFPVTGLIACYFQKDKQFFPLSGADDRNCVQTCPAWSPDGAHVVFSRAEVNEELLGVIESKPGLRIDPETRIQDLNKVYRIRYDLYRVPFNNGRGGTAEPVPGASHNGRSNYFPRYSPDGKWIVFCQSETGLVLQPESQLCIIPAEGGTARKMRCNTEIMNSWHSWSPNSKWLVFASKVNTPYTELFLTHIDRNGNDSPPVLLSRLSSEGLAANVPEFVNIDPHDLQEIRLADF